MELRNRLVMSPMENSFGTPDGRPSPRLIDYFVTRARGGVGLIIIGADLAALELAEFLAQRGRHVGILEMADQIAPEVGMKRRDEHMMSLDRAKVAINTGVRIQRIERHSVVLLLESGGEHHVRADNVILAGRVEADTNLFESLRDRVPEIYAVGDCTGLGLIKKATLEGTEAASAL
jgi:2,4-dienoyl-CoA reductase (NADPH2)